MTSDRRLVPATPAIMSGWIIEALAGGPRERNELLGMVDTLAKKEGFQVSDISALKKTLMNLKVAGLVVNIRHGWWTLPKQTFTAEVEYPESLSMGKRSISVLREIGRGAEYVYLLQYSEDVQRAQANGESAWQCKIGKSKNAAQRLLSGVSNTYLVNSPEVGLMIRCDKSANVEVALHTALKICDQHNTTSPGNEWFRTSPNHVASFYLDWMEACLKLKLTD